jgi:hypothetical protein
MKEETTMTFVEQRQHWLKLLAEQAASGLTQDQWCNAKGIKLGQFEDWQRRLALTPSEIHHVRGTFQTMLPSRHEVLLVRVGAVTIEVQAGFSPGLLAQVVHAIAPR